MITLQIIITGIAATLIMTVFMNLSAVVTRRNMYTVKILSRMLPTFFREKEESPSRSSTALALIVHYGVGILFVILYHLLRTSAGYIGNQSMAEPWIIGVLLGATAVTGWTIFIRLHPSPLLTVPWQHYLVCIFVAHIIFAFVMIWSYQWLLALLK